jgi:hypothetical protein
LMEMPQNIWHYESEQLIYPIEIQIDASRLYRGMDQRWKRVWEHLSTCTLWPTLAQHQKTCTMQWITFANEYIKS